MNHEPATLRKLIALLGEDYLDAELSVIVRDQNGNTSYVVLGLDPSDYPRHKSAYHDETSVVRIDACLSEHRLVKVRKSS